MKLKRSLIINKRNGQASVTIPSKIIKELEKTPESVFIEFSNSICSNKVRTKRSG